MENHNEVPKSRLLDPLTRVDELLIENTRAMRALAAAINLTLPRSPLSALGDMKKRLESGQEIPYLVKELAMDVARTDEPWTVEGDHLTVQTDGSLDGVTIRFNMQDADPIPVKYFNPWRQVFFKMFITHTAQAGKKLYLAIGREAFSSAMSFAIAAEMLNKVSAALDSTVATLGIGATYTGAAFSTEEYARIIGSCYADVAGTLYVDQRNDGVNWDVRDTIVYAAGALMGYSVEVVGNEARVVFLNGAVGQATFRLQAKLRRI